MYSAAELNEFMRQAIYEARISLRQGNNGFGAIIVKNGSIISSAHDVEDTESDPTSHAEINAIKDASKKLGKNLEGCILVSTHEPCPMCATAIVWSSIKEIAYGYSIMEAITQGRKRINIHCDEIFKRAGANIEIHENVLHDECAILYRNDVRAEIRKLRNANDEALEKLDIDSTQRRVKWFEDNKDRFGFMGEDILNAGYMLLLTRLGITGDEAPVIKKSDQEIVFHSRNFCPTLEACKILALDTRKICRKMNENSTDALIKQVDRRLKFTRNYEKLRPYANYCEEMIRLEKS